MRPLVLAGLVAVVLAADSTPATQTKSQWQVIQGAAFDLDRLRVDVLGWASGRVWIGFVHGNAPLKLTSLRPTAGTLTAPSKADPLRVSISGDMPTVGSDLVFQTPSLSPSDAQLRSVPLLASGKLGTPKDVPYDAAKAVPGLDFLRLNAAARVGGRDVFAFIGGTNVTANKTLHSLVVCCGASGAAADLTRLIDRRQVDSARLALDERGRLWLAWRQPGSMRIVELDRETLLPRTKPHASPGGGVERLELACAALCRLVAQRHGANDTVEIVSWAPGERSRTTVVRSAALLAASYRSGALEIAYQQWDGPAQEIRVARGDARGTRSKVVASIEIPDFSRVQRPTYWLPVGYDATCVPGGVVAIVMWEKIGSSNGATRATTAFVRRTGR
jgi:hypothetical protein